MEIKEFSSSEVFGRTSHHALKNTVSSSNTTIPVIVASNDQNQVLQCSAKVCSNNDVECDNVYVDPNRKAVGELKMEYFCTENQLNNLITSIPDHPPPVCNNASVFSTTSSEDYPSTIGFQDNLGDHSDSQHAKIISHQQSAKLSEGLFVRALIGRCKRIAPLWFRGVSSMRERNREENRRMANNNGQTQSDWQIISMKIREMNAVSETDAVANLLKKLYKELPVDSVFWFLKCWLGSEDTLADPNACVISRGDSKGRMRRIDGGKGSDKVWRLDTIVGMLYHGLPMSSTDTNIMVHTCDQELCVRPQHIRFRASSVALVVVLKALAQAGYTLIPPSIPAGSNGVAPSASDESVDVFGPFSINELQRYRSENLRPIAESYSKLTLSASDRDLVNTVPALRRAVELDHHEADETAVPGYLSSATAAVSATVKSDLPTHNGLVNGLKTEPFHTETSSACDNQRSQALSPGRLFTVKNPDLTNSSVPGSNSLVNGTLPPSNHQSHHSTTSSPPLPASIPPSVSSLSTQSLTGHEFSPSASSTTNPNFHPVLLQSCVVSSAESTPHHFRPAAARNQCPSTTTTGPTLHRPLAHHQRYSLKRPAPSDSPPPTSQPTTSRPAPGMTITVTCPDSQACRFISSGRAVETSSSPPLLISDVNSTVLEPQQPQHNGPRFTRMRLSDGDTASTPSAVMVKTQMNPMPCSFTASPLVPTTGQGLSAPPILFHFSNQSLPSASASSHEPTVYLSTSLPHHTPVNTMASLQPGCPGTDTTAGTSMNGCFLSAGDVHRPMPFPGSSGSGKNTPRQPAKKRLEARTPTIEAVGDDEISGSSLILPSLEESNGLGECSTLSLASNGSGNTCGSGGSSAFKVHQNTPFVPVPSRSGRPSSTNSGSSTTGTATGLVSKTASSSGLATPAVHLGPPQLQVMSSTTGQPGHGATAKEDEEGEMDQELVDIMAYRRESILHRSDVAQPGTQAAGGTSVLRDTNQQRAIEVLMASLAGCRYNSPAFGCHTPTNQRRSVSACSLPRVGASPNDDMPDLTALHCSATAGHLLATERLLNATGTGHNSKAGQPVGSGTSRCTHHAGAGPHAPAVLSSSSLTPPPQLLSSLSTAAGSAGCSNSSGGGGGAHQNSVTSRPGDLVMECLRCDSGTGAGALDEFGPELANIVRQSPASGISQDLIDMLCNMAQQYGMQQPRAGSRASRSSSRVAQSFYRSLINGSACASPFLPTTVVPLTSSSSATPVDALTSSGGQTAPPTGSTATAALVTPDPVLLAFSTPSPVPSQTGRLSRSLGFTPVASAAGELELSQPAGGTKNTASISYSCGGHDFGLTRSCSSVVNCNRSSTQ